MRKWLACFRLAPSDDAIVSREEVRAFGWVTLLAAVWTLVLGLIYWPGLGLEDSAARSIHAMQMAGETKLPANLFSHWFPHGLTLLMAASLLLFDSVAPLFLLQAMWLAMNVGCLLVLLAGKRVALATLAVMMVYPPIFTHAAAHLADGWTTAALCGLAICLVLWYRRARRMKAGADDTPLWVRCVILLQFLFGLVVVLTFRSNTVTVLPIVGVCMVWFVRPWPRAVAGVAALLGLLFLSTKINDEIPWERRDTVATSLVWEYVGMLKLSEDPELVERYNLDAICVKGKTIEDVIERHNWFAHDTIMWQMPITLRERDVWKVENNLVREMYPKLVRERPDLYVRMKLEIWKSIFGFRGNTALAFVHSRPPTWTEQFGVSFKPTGPLASVNEAIYKWCDRHDVALQRTTLPFIWFGLAFVGVVLAGKTRALTWPVVILLLMAMAYYAGFMLITPAVSYRYFMPSHVLLVCVIVATARRTLVRYMHA